MDYALIADMAAQQIAAAGRPCTLLKSAPGTYDTATSQATKGAPQEYPITCVTLDFSARETDGEMILVGDVRALTSSPDAAPEVGDYVRIDGARWRVINPRPLNPGGVVLFYDMQLRKG